MRASAGMDHQSDIRVDGGDGIGILMPVLRHPEQDVMQSDSGFEAESILLSLGFSHVHHFHRIPQRFRSPSQVKGIDTSSSFLVFDDCPGGREQFHFLNQCTRGSGRDPDAMHGQIRGEKRREECFRQTVSTQTEHQEAGADLLLREILLKIVFRSLQLSLEHYSNLLFEFLRLQQQSDNHSVEFESEQQQSLKPEHLSLKVLTAEILEQISSISHQISSNPDHLLILCQEDKTIHRICNLSRILRRECNRLFQLSSIIAAYESGNVITGSSSGATDA
jgi:hypothetical protein